MALSVVWPLISSSSCHEGDIQRGLTTFDWAIEFESQSEDGFQLVQNPRGGDLQKQFRSIYRYPRAKRAIVMFLIAIERHRKVSGSP